MSKVDYTILVPTVNSQKFIAETVSRIDEVFKNGDFGSYEIVVIDDGSSDGMTWNVLSEINLEYDVLSIVRLTKNFGKHAALICGFSISRGRWVVTIDDDLQQLPEDIPLLFPFREHDVVVGQFKKKNHSLWVNFGSKIKGLFDRGILGFGVRMTPLKLINSDMLPAIIQASGNKPFIPALLSMVTTDIVGVEIRHEKGRRQKSSYTFLTRCRQFLDLVIGNSNFALRVMGFLGAISSLFAFCFGIIIFVKALTVGNFTSGWASIILVNLTFGGLILMSLSINGEYLLRILKSSNRQPSYVVKESLDER